MHRSPATSRSTRSTLAFTTLLLWVRVPRTSSAFLLQQQQASLTTTGKYQCRSSKDPSVCDHSKIFNNIRPHRRSCTIVRSTPTREDSNNAGGYLKIAKSNRRSLRALVSDDPTRSAAFSVLLAIICGVMGPLLQAFRFASGAGTLGAPTAAVEVWQWWPIPELYGAAGLLVGWTVVLMDDLFDTDLEKSSPSTDKALLGFGLFLSQYLLAGVLYEYNIDEVTIFASTMFLAGYGFSALDGTTTGVVAGALAAMAGPMAEESLVSVFQGLEQQTSVSAVITAPVYFLGSIVCGNIARALWLSASTSPRACREETYTIDKPRCSACQDTRAVECVACGALGYGATSDGNRHTCNVCGGRGLMFCKECASFYGDDPNDEQRIEEIMSHMPD